MTPPEPVLECLAHSAQIKKKKADESSANWHWQPPSLLGREQPSENSVALMELWTSNPENDSPARKASEVVALLRSRI